MLSFSSGLLVLKPFYADFIERLSDVTFKQHLMRYFVEFEVTRAELEDLQLFVAQ